MQVCAIFPGRCRSVWTSSFVFCALVLAGVSRAQAQAAAQPEPAGQPQLVWVDTDIGDDIDDAFALALILRSPEFKVLGISTAFGDTELRARLVDRYLAAVGASSIPVYAGVHTQTDNVFTQKAYALRSPARKHAEGTVAMLDAIRKHPGQVTLIAIGPLFNIGAAIGRDPATFRLLRRVVLMGGSVDRGYDGSHGERRPPDPEWNIEQDPAGAEKLFQSGVQIFAMPLDSTQVHLDAAARDKLFAAGTPLTDQLTLLYHQWIERAEYHPQTPTLYDPVAVAYALRPDVCPATPMRLEVDAKGFTRKVEGEANVNVCLKSDEAEFLKLLLGRLVQ